ncbi:murein hydrolase activator NlpD [Vibrio sp. T187]|uniref:murein hydrolase activator NlpD n=1 Tax=Vibrio TaxID=662 RepID=UPI0010C96F52|nr:MULTISPECIES: murein hydrolase activator NlpD [Vibrio]MBW3694113.1 murein hydrolase activator NlpD [Vibrio sp. T187]
MGSGLLKVLTFGLCCLLVGCAAHTPAPVSGLNKDYSSVARGSYRGSYYQVKKGDTLYFIAYITDKNVNDLISFNNLSKPYTIHPGQKLNLWAPAYVAPSYGKATVTATAPVAVASTATAASTTPSSSSKSNKNSNQVKSSAASKTVKKDPVKKVEQSKRKEYVDPKGKQNVNTAKASTNNKVSKWLWPTKGRVIKNFSVGEQGNKGIDIAGQRGQSIVSTAGGTVVYSGNALRGYGNLIIVKHNDNYLSAYAHNDRLLVSEGQSVKPGQKIATMGSSGTNSVRLHFEIRYQGKSVNPKRYLP